MTLLALLIQVDRCHKTPARFQLYSKSLATLLITASPSQAAAPAQSVPDVRLTKTVSKALNKQGGKFNYTFSVNNLGSLEPGNAGTAWNVIVSDSFPIGVAPTSSYWIEPSSASSGELQAHM